LYNTTSSLFLSDLDSVKLNIISKITLSLLEFKKSYYVFIVLIKDEINLAAIKDYNSS